MLRTTALCAHHETWAHAVIHVHNNNIFKKSKIIAVAFPQAIAMVRQGDPVYWGNHLGWERQKSVVLMASSTQTCAPFSAHSEKKMRHTEVGHEAGKWPHRMRPHGKV